MTNQTPTMYAVFYRHWLEIRGGLLVTGIATAVFGAISVVALVGSRGSGEGTMALGTHAWMTAIVALVAAIVVNGSGIRTNDFQLCHPSFQYTLTLPVHRTSWILTRFATGVAGTVAPVTAIFAVDALVTLGLHNDVPIEAMARSSMTILFVALITGTAVGVVFPIWRNWMGPIGVTAVFTAFIMFASNALNGYTPFPNWPRPMRMLVERPPDNWQLAAATLFIITGLVWLGTSIARRTDL